jgi:hypothetical protein
MNVLIISAPFYKQADTVLDSINAFTTYGNMKYKVVFTTNGDITISLGDFDAVILHYSLIKYPFKFKLPLSPELSVKLRLFTGIKVAMVQDEQRSCMERLQFLNGIKLNHLFSVAPADVIEILYPERIRDFTVSTVLTGYITNRLISNWHHSRAENQRDFDAIYRGRVLPDWYGETSLLKNHISDEILKVANLANLRVDVSSNESARIYGENWLKFLTTGYVAVGTPSGSGRLDMYGKYPESFVPNLPENFAVDDPIDANYFVISPKVFEYISSNCLLALTAGRYSEIAIENRHFLALSENAENLPEIVKFSVSKHGESMRLKCVDEILFNKNYHISNYVIQVETIINSLFSRNKDFNATGLSPRFETLTEKVKIEFQDSFSSSLKRRFRSCRYFLQNSALMFSVLGLVLSLRVFKGLLHRTLDWRFVQICFFMVGVTKLDPAITFTITKEDVNEFEILIDDPQLYQGIFFRKSNFGKSKISLNLGAIDVACGLTSNCKIPYSLVQDLVKQINGFNRFDQSYL